jgi:acylphosphatase
MSSGNVVRARIWVSGRVQGVGYRAFVQEVATRSGLSGGVRNLDDGRVEVDVEGERSAVDAFVNLLKSGPCLARVEGIEVKSDTPTGQQGGFRIWH